MRTELTPDDVDRGSVRSSVIRTALDDIHGSLVDNTSGEVAGYIPELARVDPDPFGIAVATVDGHVYETGDANALFTIQSISKAFVFGLALDDHGATISKRRCRARYTQTRKQDAS